MFLFALAVEKAGPVTVYAYSGRARPGLTSSLYEPGQGVPRSMELARGASPSKRHNSACKTNSSKSCLKIRVAQLAVIPGRRAAASPEPMRYGLFRPVVLITVGVHRSRASSSGRSRSDGFRSDRPAGRPVLSAPRSQFQQERAALGVRA